MDLKLEFILILVFRSKKSVIFCEDFKLKFFWKILGHAESNPPPVLAAFIYASYLCLIQDSSTVFALTSHEMAVSPFLLISISLCIIFIYQKTFRFCSRVKSLNIVPRDTVVLYDGWSFLSLTCESQETGSCSSAYPVK